MIQEMEEAQYDWSSCTTTDTETDSLGSWTNYDKAGVAWHLEEQILEELPCRSSRRSRVKDFDLKEIFWKICLENNPHTLMEEMNNLPFWDSPDIFLDAEDDQDDHNDSGDESLEFFQSIKHIFDEPSEKSWNEEQKFGLSWDHHLDYYEEREKERRREVVRRKEWRQSQLEELIESLDTAHINLESHVSSQDKQMEDVEFDPAVFAWSEADKFGSSWEEHLELISGPSAAERSYIWSREKIIQIIDGLQPVDFDESFLKGIVVSEDSEEIFEENRLMFEEEREWFESAPTWSEDQRFGASWEQFLVEYEGQDRNINWNFLHKFGVSWAPHLAEIEEAAGRQLRRQVRPRGRRSAACDITEVFWDIALKALHEPNLLQIIRNLPVSDTPDIFTDSSQMFFDPKVPKYLVSQEEILDIFDVGKAIFVTSDNPDEDISICNEVGNSQKSQMDKKTKRSALASFKTFFTRMKVVRRKPLKRSSFEKNDKVWWKKIKIPKLRRNLF